MKMIFCLGLLGLAVTAQAQDRLLTVSPRSLGEWTLIGGRADEFSRAGNLVVPPRAQLSRDFGSAAVVVRANTRPVWSTDSREWPILELGSLALAMIQRNEVNQVVLVIDESEVVALPWEFEKDAMAEIFFGYDPVSGTGMVSNGGEFHYFDARQTGRAVGLSFAAGERSPWEFSLVEVMLLAQPEDAGTANEGSAGQKNSREKMQDLLKSSAEKMFNGDHAGGKSRGIQDIQSGTEQGAESSPHYLVVFTPETIRINRADVIRNKIAAQSK